MIKISIEDVQKINNMVSELLKKRIVDTREEAVKMAEGYLNKKLVNKQKSKRNVASSEGDLEYYRNMFERTKEYMQKELKNFRHAVETIAKEIGKIKQEVNNLKIQGEARSVKDSELSGKNVKEAAEKQENLEEGNNKEFHPKQGRLKSEDVSVEKMFYYGNK